MTVPSARSVAAPRADDDVVDDLVQLAFTVMPVLTRVGAAHDLSLTQMRLLGILRDRQPMMAELAVHLGLERSTITGLVDRAESRGLVRRAAAPEDGRAVRVALSPAGRRLARAVEAEVAEELASMTDRLSRPERAQLHRLADRLLSRDLH